MTFVTALRTAAISALVASRMARSASRVMALIGNGAQSEFQAIAFHRLAGVRELRLYDTDPHATAKLIRNLTRLQISDLAVTRCASTAEAVRGADIVTTVTADKCNATILTPDMIEPGMHLNAVGGDCPGKTELHADILRAGMCASWSSSSRRRESKARSNNWAAQARSPSSRTYYWRDGRLGRAIARSPFSIRWALRSTTSRRCATCIA
jgi:ornithine cyclodeaminase/alanine dehydrogenase-like protein (mu-crystallin family)